MGNKVKTEVQNDEELRNELIDEDVEDLNEELAGLDEGAVKKGKKKVKEEEDDYDDDDDDDDDDEEEVDEEFDGEEEEDEEFDGEEEEDREAKAVADVKKAVDAAPTAKPLPKTKAGMLTAAFDRLSSMKKEELRGTVKGILGEDFDTTFDKNGTDDEVNESVFEEDLNALVESEATLSEGFKEKASVIFEAAMKSKLAQHVQELEESYEQELQEEVQSIEEDLTNKIDGYLDYVVETWMEENQLAIDKGIRTEIAESFMTALHSVFTEHYIEVPESKVDLVDELSEKVKTLEEELDTSMEKAMTLNESVKELKKEAILREASKALTETQAEKLKGLTEDMDFDSEQAFALKVETIRESYFKADQSKDNHAKSLMESEEIDSSDYDFDVEEKKVSPAMARYLSALKQK